MEASGPTTTDVLQTIFIGLQLLVLVAAALFARRQLNEAKKLREEQIRPFVVLDLTSEERPFFYLSVKNIGSTMARDIRFEFDQMPTSTMGHGDLERLKMFREGISTLPPGKEIKTLFDSAIQRYPSDLPETYRVTVSYTDPDGERHYREEMDLDFGLYWNRLSVERKGIHHIHQELERIRKDLSKWSANVGSGIQIATDDDVKRRTAKIEEQWAEPEPEADEGSGEDSEEAGADQSSGPAAED